MNEVDKLYAKLGRMQAEIEDRNGQYCKLLSILSQVVSGELDRSRVMVNLTDQTFCWSAPGERPSMPAQINGMPVCVMAPTETDAPAINTEAAA